MFQDDDPQLNHHDVIRSQEESDAPLNESLGGHEVEELSQHPKRELWFFPRYDDHSPPHGSQLVVNPLQPEKEGINLSSLLHLILSPLIF